MFYLKYNTIKSNIKKHGGVKNVKKNNLPKYHTHEYGIWNSCQYKQSQLQSNGEH